MKHYFIIVSIFLVLVLGSLFLFPKRTVEVETIHYTDSEISQAFKTLEFEIKRPNDLPNNMTMREATIGIINKKQQIIGVRYHNDENIYGFEFSATTSDESLNYIASKDKYWNWTETEIKGNQGLVGVNATTKEKSIVFRDDAILYRFFSKQIDTSELLSIAESIE